MRKYAVWLIVGLFVCPDLGSRPPSLANPTSSTCYFNSLLQNLYNMEPITEALLAQKGAQPSPLLDSYVALIARFYAGQVSGFADVLESLSKKLFEAGRASGGLAAGAQGDPTEAFSYLANPNGVQVPIFKKKMGFWDARKNIYYGVEGDVEELGRKEQELSLMPEYPGDMKIVNQNVLLQTGFSLSEHPDYAPAGTGFTLVGKCPEIFMVWVKVFGGVFDKITKTYTGSRITTNFDGGSFLTPLDIKDFVVADDKGFKDPDTVYNLIGVSCQSGSYSGGHYIALIKDQYDPDRRWYYCSDSTVYEIDKQEVAKTIKTQGYVFFYRKKSSEEASIARQQAERDLRNLTNVLHHLAQPDAKKK